MHRIDDPTAVPTLPAPRPPGTPGYFTGGSPGSSGFAATVVRYEFMNAVQEELAAIAEAAGLVLDKTNNQQVLAALRQMLRFRLTQDETFYISPTGSDDNDGLTPATALATGQAAWNKALAIDLNNHNLILQFMDGTYTSPILCQGTPLGIGAASGIIIRGNVAQPSNVVFSVTNSACIVAENATVYVQGITFQATGIPTGPFTLFGTALFANIGGIINFGNCVFQHCDYVHLMSINGGIVLSQSQPYTIAGGSGRHAVAALGGQTTIVNSAISITGNPAFSTCFADAETNGILAAYGAAFSGAASGPRYSVGTGGIIHTGGGGATFFPGNAAGFVDPTTFGIYL